MIQAEVMQGEFSELKEIQNDWRVGLTLQMFPGLRFAGCLMQNNQQKIQEVGKRLFEVKNHEMEAELESERRPQEPRSLRTDQ